MQSALGVHMDIEKSKNDRGGLQNDTPKGYPYQNFHLNPRALGLSRFSKMSLVLQSFLRDVRGFLLTRRRDEGGGKRTWL